MRRLRAAWRRAGSCGLPLFRHDPDSSRSRDHMNSKLERRTVLMGLLMAVTLALAAPVGAAPAGQDATTTVTIVSTNDFHGALEGTTVSGRPAGSAEWLAGYIHIVEQENPGGVLWLDRSEEHTS